MNAHSKYLHRCLSLAKLGSGYVAPNPMVGAVLVHDDQIIGEGWHQRYGEAHAEVNCLASVKDTDKDHIPRSVLYVSLEPCAHFGKTPPCADLIIRHKIPKVVIGCADPFLEVNGKGIDQLRSAGIDVEMADPALANKCKNLNRRFFIFHKEKRPYIILKWAQTGDGFMAASPNPSTGGAVDSITSYDSYVLEDTETPHSGGREAIPSGRNGAFPRLLISNDYTNHLVHKWRSNEAVLLVGTDTALLDDPALTTRLWPGPTPIRLVLDRHLRLPAHLTIFNGQGTTIVFNQLLHDIPGNVLAGELGAKPGAWHYKIKTPGMPLKEIMDALYQLKIQSVLVEGGAKILQSFIHDGLWDTARVISNENLIINSGLKAPQLEQAILTKASELHSDTIKTYFPAKKDNS